MNELLAIISFFVIAALAALGVVYIRRRPRKLDQEFFQKGWHELQKLCGDKTTWKEAVIEADSLLAAALKKKRIGGKATGERLVKVQRILTDNDGVWFGHKLRNKIDAEPKMRLKEKEVKQALLGIRQALKDLGALPDGKS